MIALGLGTGQGPKAPIPGQAVPASGHRDPRSARPCSAPGPQPGTAVQIHDAYSGGCHAHVCEFWPAAAWDDDADIYPERTVVRPPGSRPRSPGFIGGTGVERVVDAFAAVGAGRP